MFHRRPLLGTLILALCIVCSASFFVSCQKPGTIVTTPATPISAKAQLIQQNQRLALANQTAVQVVTLAGNNRLIKPSTALGLLEYHLQVAEVSQAIAKIAERPELDAAAMQAIRDQALKLAMPAVYENLWKGLTPEEKAAVNSSLKAVSDLAIAMIERYAQ